MSDAVSVNVAVGRGVLVALRVAVALGRRVGWRVDVTAAATAVTGTSVTSDTSAVTSAVASGAAVAGAGELGTGVRDDETAVALVAGGSGVDVIAAAISRVIVTSVSGSLVSVDSDRIMPNVTAKAKTPMAAIATITSFPRSRRIAYRSPASTGSNGSATLKRLPTFAWVSIQISPPCASTSALAIASPTPVSPSP